MFSLINYSCRARCNGRPLLPSFFAEAYRRRARLTPGCFFPLPPPSPFDPAAACCSTRARLTPFASFPSNYAFSHLSLKLGWRLMLGIGAAPSVILALMVLGMPESPRWLVMKGRLADAKVVLSKTSDTPEEAALRLADIKEAAGIPAGLDGNVVAVPKRTGGEERVWKELILSPTPAVRRVLLSALGIHFFQQSSGIDSIIDVATRTLGRLDIRANDHVEPLALVCQASQSNLPQILESLREMKVVHANIIDLATRTLRGLDIRANDHVEPLALVFQASQSNLPQILESLRQMKAVYANAIPRFSTRATIKGKGT